MSIISRLTRSRHIHDEVGERFRNFISTGKILDLPAGDGINSRRLHQAGFEVTAADLYLDDIQGEGFKRIKADLVKPLPFENAAFDGVLFSEGIEHLDSQIAALVEMARILRPGGILLVTTPNLLSLSARLNFLLIGHAHNRRAAVVSAAQYWGDSKTGDKSLYFGHVFLINAFQIKFYLEHAGFEIVDIDTARFSINSLLLAPVLYPAVWMATKRFLSRPKSKLSATLQQIYMDQILSPAVLFGKKLIVTARKC